MKKFITLILFSTLSFASYSSSIDFCVGDHLVRTVIGQHFNVQILAIYQDGTVDVSYPNSNYVNANISIKELSRSLETLQGISVGDKLVRTVIGQHYNVQVLEIYEDGTADVSYPNTDYVNGNVSITELGPSSDKN